MNPLRQFFQNVRAKAANYYVTKQVTDTLKIAHAKELSETLGEQWPQVMARHAAQIKSVAAGKLDITERRSWQFPYLPSTLTRLQQPIIKLVPLNLRKFARTPVPRRAINLIKNSVTSLAWDVVPIKNANVSGDADQLARIEIARNCFLHPNNEQSFQSFLETGIDDFCTMGAMVVEPQITPNPNRPIKFWNVDASTIRFFPNWNEAAPEEPKYAQMTGLKGERGVIVFYDDELMYIKDNPSVETPFGTSKMEIAFKSIVAFLGVQDMAGSSASTQVHKTWLWWENGVNPSNLDILRRHIVNDLEGQSSINLMSGMKSPETIDITTTSIEDLMLPWQEFLIRVICYAFDMSAQAFLERDVNRSTGEVLSDMDFRSSVVPTAVRIQEYFTRFILHRKLGWTDLEFKFLNIDDPDLATKIDMLAKQYSMNATFPDEIRAELGKEPLGTAFGKLTQLEAILMNTEASANIQDKTASKAFDRQQTAQQQQMEQYQQMQQQQQGPSEDVASAAAPAGPPKAAGVKPLKLPALVLPKLPQMPMAGSRYSAHQIAAMSVTELTAAMGSGAVPSDPDTLTQNMQSQDPGILLQMEPEVQKYLDMLKQKKQDDMKKSKPSLGKSAAKLQLQKFKDNKHVPSEIEKTVYSNPNNAATAPRRTVGSGRGKEIATTDVSKARVKRRKPRSEV